MKSQSVYLIFVFALIASLATCATPPKATLLPTLSPTTVQVTSTATIRPPTPTPGVFGERVERGEITSKALEGNLIGDPAKRTFWVYLPPGYYESDKHYPVVYVLHWDGGNSVTFVERSRDALEKLINSGAVMGMILVFPDAYTSFGGSQYRSSPTIGDYETYITKEMVDLIESTFRTIPNRNSRGIMGCSMGGFGTWHLALKYPEVYGVAAPMEGRVDEQWLKDVWDEELTHMNSTSSPEKEPNNFGDIMHIQVRGLWN